MNSKESSADVENKLSLHKLLISILLYLKSIVNGYPDLLNENHTYLFFNILKQEILNDDNLKLSVDQLNELIDNGVNLLDDKEIMVDTNEINKENIRNQKIKNDINETNVMSNEIINLVLDFISYTIILHETNRELWMNNGLLTILFDIFNNRKKSNKIIMKILKIFRFMCLDDDIRVQISNTHERIRKISDLFLPILTLKIGDNFKNDISDFEGNKENSNETSENNKKESLNNIFNKSSETNDSSNSETPENDFKKNQADINKIMETSENSNSETSGKETFENNFNKNRQTSGSINKTTKNSENFINNESVGNNIEITSENSFGKTAIEEKPVLQFKTQLIKTISYLCVRNEHCMIIYENKGIESVRNILDNMDLARHEHFTEYHIDLFITIMFYLKTIAGNDDVKNLIYESGIIKNIINIMINDELKNNIKLNESFLLLLSTLTLRHENIINQLIDWNIFEIIVPIMNLNKNNVKIIKYGCWTIRNVCSRNRTSIDLLFHVDGVQLLEECLNVHKSIQYDIKNTMKELGESVHVEFDEQWKGKGQCNIKHEF